MPSADIAALRGFTVGVTTERRWRDQAEVLGRRGARVVHGPVVGPLPLVRREALQAALDDLLRHPPEMVVFPTGPALESWLAVGEHLGCDQSLARLTTAAGVVVGAGVADGARAAGMVVHGEIPMGTTAASVEGLRELAPPGSCIALQMSDRSTDDLAASLRAAGFDVVAIPLCPRELPDDLAPALALVDAALERRIDAVTFTESAEVRNLVAIAATANLDAALVTALGGDVVPACMGAACAAAAVEAGMGGVVQPATARAGAMVDALASHLEGAAVRTCLNGVDVEIRGSLVLVGDDEVWLTGRERDVLAVLARRPGIVVAKAELLRRVWSSSGVEGLDGHVVEVAVARLRRRLGPAGRGLVTVPRRGYRLVPADEAD